MAHRPQTTVPVTIVRGPPERTNALRWTTGRSPSAAPGQPLKVTLFSINFWPESTGIGPYARDVAGGLRARGHEVRVVTAYPHYPQWKVPASYRHRRGVTESIDGVCVKRLRHYVPRSPTRFKRALSEVIFGVRVALTWWGNPDVAVFISPALLSTSIAVATRGVGCRRGVAIGVVVQDLYSSGVRELGSSTGRLLDVIDRTEGALLKTADGVVTIHERFREQIVLMDVDHTSVRVIRNWSKTVPTLDWDGREASRAALGWSPDDVIVLHAGAMGNKQGLENVIEAARLADQEAPLVKFVFLGDGSRRRHLEHSSRGLTTVQFMDPLPEDSYQHALRSADVLLINELPQLEQTAVPSKLTSYLATGSPVLAAVRPGGVTEGEVMASGGGICVPAGEPRQLLRAVLEVSSDPVGRARLGERGLDYCSRVLSKDNALDSYDDWIRELAGKRRKGEQWRRRK